jgi:hypothetical protein
MPWTATRGALRSRVTAVARDPPMCFRMCSTSIKIQMGADLGVLRAL